MGGRAGYGAEAAFSMRQGWRCEVCKARSAVSFKRDAGVWEVVQRINASHKRRSSDCLAGLHNLRLTNWRHVGTRRHRHKKPRSVER